METLQIIAYVMAVLANGILAYTAMALHFKMRRMQKDLDTIKVALRHMFAMTMSAHVQSTFDQVEKMKKALRELIENEQYEDAEHLHNAIEQAQEGAMKQLESFKKLFGDDTIEINIAKRTTD